MDKHLRNSGKKKHIGELKGRVAPLIWLDFL
jgi:hypothetical protein